ncbi:MAG: hypothetical protein ABW215_11230 [Kibdelosporangium sp.]
MELVPPSPEMEALFSRQEAEYERLVRASSLPLLGMAEPAPQPRLLGEAEINGGVVESVGLAYGDLMRPSGPLVQVHTARWRDNRASPPDLRQFLENLLDSMDDNGPVDGDPVPAHVVVNGTPRPASLLRTRRKMWAARCWHQDSDIIVVAREWELAATHLVAVPNLEPFLRGRRDYIRDLRENPPTMPIMDRPFDVATAHRSLIDATLARRQQLEAAAREGRPPRLRANGRKHGELWEAAVRAQMHLADQSRQDANEVVTILVNQLGRLQEKAGWFANRRLRDAAVTETLLYWTGMRTEQLSRPAQESWRTVWASQRSWSPDPFARQERTSREHDDSLRRWHAELMTGQDEWLRAWSEWVRQKGY